MSPAQGCMGITNCEPLERKSRIVSPTQGCMGGSRIVNFGEGPKKVRVSHRQHQTSPIRELYARTPMASTTFSLAVARSQLDRNGFVDLEDGAMGDYVQQMERKGFPLVSDYGLAFCKERVLEDEVSVSTPCHFR